MVAVLHEETVCDGRVRYYRSPVYDRSGTEDFPWASLVDVVCLSGVPYGEVPAILARPRADWAEPRTVASGSGIEVIVPFFMADALLDGAATLKATEDARRRRGGFRRGNTAALKKMLAGRPQLAVMAFALAAMDAVETAYPRKPLRSGRRNLLP